MAKMAVGVGPSKGRIIPSWTHPAVNRSKNREKKNFYSMEIQHDTYYKSKHVEFLNFSSEVHRAGAMVLNERISTSEEGAIACLTK